MINEQRPLLRRLWNRARHVQHSTTVRARLARWQCAAALARNRGECSADEAREWAAALHNRLPNVGGLPVDAEKDVQSIISSARKDPKHRGTSLAGFEGVALDDALTFYDTYKHYSFFPLARAIVQIGKRFVRETDLSMLELGCGGGDLFHFLERLGVRRYVGIDANPLAAQFSPNVTGHESHFRLLNLQQEIDLGCPFDLVFTFEVLEHIPEDKLGGMIRTIRNHMDRRSIFIGTASLQEDYDVHVTVQRREFWLAKFAEYGLVPHADAATIEAHLARNHPFNWSSENTNILALRLQAPREGGAQS